VFARSSPRGKNRSTLQSVLWQADANVRENRHVWAGGDAAIPVEFSIPSDAYESNHNDRTIRCSGFCTRSGTSRREFFG